MHFPAPREEARGLEDMKKRMRIRIYGIVQGVGFRPFVSRTAMKRNIYGSVCNKGSYVEIFAQADEEELDAFLDDLKNDAPERSVIMKIKTVPLETVQEVDSGDGSDARNGRFNIIDSEKEDGLVFVSPDIATCPDCRRELFDSEDRRYLHPFINCTQCGPRLTILDSMPYDRERTSMKEFPMCPQCEYEYTHSSTRRYHAQPVCCNDCGPELYVIGREEKGSEAIIYARKILRDGGIVAVKGIGGFHLACDAKNSEAVDRLRKLKNRPFKPFAVMMKDMDTVRRECEVLEGEEKILDGPQKPIILLRKKATGETADAAAPENPNLGVMLPYAPVQMLLFDYPDGEDMTDCLIMTSGNPSGAPICMNDEEAVKYLSPMSDAILSNNRKIRIRADDSVMAFYDGKPYMIRRSRGYAPLPVVAKDESVHSVLGIGGELKNTFCLAKSDMFYPSPYIGDMADVRSTEALEAAVERMERLLEIKPEIAVCDMHPGYNTTEMAKMIADREKIPMKEIQHHYAHVLSCMAENEFDGQVIGVSMDGTGYGTDGTIWGGEILKADMNGFERLGSISKFTHAGGDLASKECWRIAYSLLTDFCESPEELEFVTDKFDLGTEQERKAMDFMLQNHVNTVTSTSAGRIFDAVSAILGFKKVNTFEGEAAMALQFAAERAAREGRRMPEYEGRLMNIDEDEFRLTTDSLVCDIANRRIAGADPDELALYFHEALAQMIVVGCCYARTTTRINTAALTGGVFQNLLLLSLTEAGLKREGFRVLRHSLIPPNDGGLALGQAAAGMAALAADDESKEV